MKLKSIASLCKNRKMVYIYSGSGCQYIGQGCACWMVPGTHSVMAATAFMASSRPGIMGA